MKLSKELAKQAAKFGICQEWHTKLKSLEDKKELIKMYLSGIDFCLSNDYPNNDFIRANFKGFMEDFGVFLDDNIELSNTPKCVALGETTGSIELDGYCVSEIFIKHKSNLNIIAKDNAFVMIDVFDNVKLTCEAYGNAKVCINIYGNATIESKEHDSGLIKIKDKQKKTY